MARTVMALGALIDATISSVSWFREDGQLDFLALTCLSVACLLLTTFLKIWIEALELPDVMDADDP